MKQRTEIEVELSETVHYGSARRKFEAFCPNCEAMVEMATARAAALLTDSTEREIFRFIETRQIHFIETDSVLICLNSLRDIKKQKSRSIDESFEDENEI